LTVVTIPLAAGLDAVLKALIDRPRPFVGDPAVHPLIARPHDPSMPSGHALTAFACATVIGLLVPPVRLPAYGLAAAIAVSRVYLGVHYPSDVLVGAAIGCGLGVAVVVGARAGVRALRPAH
ncbi:MAG TPA: phosphatase PAP2 family protein, partial [Gaiellales bacterium]|nr:phosphatase PAP2 family protein [Gaiellales bacterium]